MVTYGPKGSQSRKTAGKNKGQDPRSLADLVRQMREGAKGSPGEDYRERALAIYGLLCSRCSREFDEKNRHLLTIHHRDGDHHNNPPDGSNWEPLCAYCHEDIHSRSLLGDYLQGQGEQQVSLVYGDASDIAAPPQGLGLLGQKLKLAMEKKKK